MSHFLTALLETCEIAIQRNDKGWQVYAKGGAALMLLVLIGGGGVCLLMTR